MKISSCKTRYFLLGSIIILSQMTWKWTLSMNPSQKRKIELCISSQFYNDIETTTKQAKKTTLFHENLSFDYLIWVGLSLEPEPQVILDTTNKIVFSGWANLFYWRAKPIFSWWAHQSPDSRHSSLYFTAEYKIENTF